MMSGVVFKNGAGWRYNSGVRYDKNMERKETASPGVKPELRDFTRQKPLTEGRQCLFPPFPTVFTLFLF
jgi:hypothetical protein